MRTNFSPRYFFAAVFQVLLCAALLPHSALAEKGRYAAAGVPSPDSRWSGTDYQQAASVLAKETVPLPLAGAAGSAADAGDAEARAVFERIVSEENLESFQDAATPLSTRIPAYLQVQEQTNSLLKLYLAAFNEGRIKSSIELTRMMAFMLHLGSVGIQLINDFIPTIPKDDKYEIRMAGLQKMKTGMTKMFGGLEQSLGETKVYSPADLSMLLKAMKRELPVYKPMFEEGYTAKLTGQLRAHLKTFSQPADKAIINAMIAELETPAAPPAAIPSPPAAAPGAAPAEEKR